MDQNGWTSDSSMTLVPASELDLHSQMEFADPLAITEDDILREIGDRKALVCRLCAGVTDSCIYIFDIIGESMGLAKKINDCLPIVVKPTDHLPKQICKECYVQLVEVYNLAEMCLQSDDKLSRIHANDFFRAKEMDATFSAQPKNFLHNCFQGLDPKSLNHYGKIYGCPFCKEGKMTSESTLKLNDSSSPVPDTAVPPVLTVESSGMYVEQSDEPSSIDNDNTSSCGSFLTNDNTSSNMTNNFTRAEVSAQDTDEMLNTPLNVELTSFGLDNKFDGKNNSSAIVNRSESLGLVDYKLEEEGNRIRSISQSVDVDPLKFSDEPSQSKNVSPSAANQSLFKLKSSHDNDSSTNESSKTLKVTGLVPKKNSFPNHCDTCGLPFRKKSTMLKHKCIGPLPPSKKCDVCLKTFRSHNKLLFHMKFHAGAKPGYCEKCQKTFCDETKLYKHTLYLHGGEKKHCCEECGKLFRSGSSLNSHKRVHLGEMKPFTCHQCGKCFIKKSMLKNHITTSHNFSSLEENCFACKVCDEIFPTTDQVIAHMERCHIEASANEIYSFTMHTISKLYTCEYCERYYAEGAALNRHRDKHSNENPYECKICSCTFTTYLETRYHNIDAHVNVPPLLEYSSSFTLTPTYLCEFCDRCFSNYAKFSEHLTIHFGNKPYTCRYCNIRLATISEAVEHRLTHRDTEEPTEDHNCYKPYECHYCNKAFPLEDALKRHIRMHTGEKPFICDQCGKGFSQSSGLYTHQKVHSNVRPYECYMCHRTFKIKGDRDVHMRKHSGDRPYKCEFCGKSFMTQHVYSQHRKIHTGERPYKCDVCGTAFRRSHVLTVHKRIHTGEKPHVCDVCGKRYRQRGDMKKHKRIKHGVLKVQPQTLPTQ